MSDRPQVWRGGASVMLVLAALAGGSSASAAPPAGFSPPSQMLLLTRTLTRALPDGKAIIARRSYELRVLRDGTGFRVEGKLVATTVEAPPSLAPLAEIERKRPDIGMFPILLDANGVILPGQTRPTDNSADRAAQMVSERIGASGMIGLDVLETQAFVARMRSNSARRNWPTDIFNPEPGKRNESHRVALPGGESGTVTIEIAAEGADASGQIAELDRTVTTDLAGDKRVIHENWHITRHAANSER